MKVKKSKKCEEIKSYERGWKNPTGDEKVVEAASTPEPPTVKPI